MGIVLLVLLLALILGVGVGRRESASVGEKAEPANQQGRVAG